MNQHESAKPFCLNKRYGSQRQTHDVKERPTVAFSAPVMPCLNLPVPVGFVALENGLACKGGSARAMSSVGMAGPARAPTPPRTFS